MSALALGLAAWLSVHHPLAPWAVLAVACLAAVFAALYMISRRSVWVSLDERGLAARGMTGRPVLIDWRADAEVTSARRSGMPGVDVRVTANAGLAPSSASSVFIPEVILASPEFAEAVRDLAPDGHRLRRHTVGSSPIAGV